MFTDSSSKYPDYNKLVTGSQKIADMSLSKMEHCVSCGSSGANFKKIVSEVSARKNIFNWADFHKLIGVHFATSLQTKKFLLPSALWSTIFSSMQKLASSVESQRAQLEKILSKITSESNKDLLQLFIGEFILCFGESLLTFIKDCVMETAPPTARRCIISFDQEDRQTIHYIGGFILSKFRKAARKCPKIQDWKKITEVIDTRMDEAGQDVTPCADIDKQWTFQRNRDGLIIIGAKCFNFFLSVAAMLCNIVEPDGILILEKVLTTLYTSRPALIWDDMVPHHILEENLSIKFLTGAVKSFAQTFGRGLRKLTINDIFKTPCVSMALRHSVAPRSKK